MLVDLDAWLLTNGANAGIVQLIGQTIRKRKLTKPQDTLVAVGVCNYGCVKNVQDFQRLSESENLEDSTVSLEQSAVSSGRSQICC